METYVTAETLSAKAERWLQDIAPFNQHEMRLNRPASALLIVDMQEFFLDPQSPTFTGGGPAIVPVVRALADCFRESGRPVLYTKHAHHPGNLDSGIMGWWWKGMCVEGSRESEIHGALAPRPGDKVVTKRRYSAFFGTDLEIVLRCLKIEDLVIAGIMTNMCVESTARDAYYRDFRVFIPADGTGSVTEEMHRASLLNLAFGFAFVARAERFIEDLQSRIE